MLACTVISYTHAYGYLFDCVVYVPILFFYSSHPWPRSTHGVRARLEEATGWELCS